MKKEEKELFIESLYSEMYPLLHRYATIRLNNPDLAQEFVQNVFVIALRKFQDLKNSSNPQGWLMVVLKNLLNNEMKSRMKKDGYLDARPIELVETAEEVNKLDITYGDLVDVEDYKLLKSVFVDRFTAKETAQELGISPSTCGKRIQKARMKMKKALEKI